MSTANYDDENTQKSKVHLAEKCPTTEIALGQLLECPTTTKSPSFSARNPYTISGNSCYR